MSEGEKHRFEYCHFRPHVLAIPDAKAHKCERYMRGVTQWKPNEHGGATLCHVYNDGNEPLAWGLAFCCMRDNFSYRLGREIAKGRALATLRGVEPKKFNGYNLSGDGSWPKSMEWFFVPA